MTCEAVVECGGASVERTLTVAQDLQGLRFDVSSPVPLHVVEPPVERPTAALTRTGWERKLGRRVMISDAVVVAIAVGVAHVMRYFVLPLSPEALLRPGPSALQTSIAVF